MVVMYRFKIFFKNALGFTNRLNGQFLLLIAGTPHS